MSDYGGNKWEESGKGIIILGRALSVLTILTCLFDDDERKIGDEIKMEIKIICEQMAL